MDWLEFTAIVVSVVALMVSLLQFFVERQRVRRGDTIHELAKLQKEVFNQRDYLNANVEEVLAEYQNAPDGQFPAAWDAISGYMARIEQFAVGVNTNVYDLKTLDRMSGIHFIRQYERLFPIIRHKRVESGSNKRYEEFEQLVRKLAALNPGIQIPE